MNHDTEREVVQCNILLLFNFSPLVESLLDHYSLDGTLLILGALVLNCVTCGLLFRHVLQSPLVSNIHQLQQPLLVQSPPVQPATCETTQECEGDIAREQFPYDQVQCKENRAKTLNIDLNDFEEKECFIKKQYDASCNKYDIAYSNGEDKHCNAENGTDKEIIVEIVTQNGGKEVHVHGQEKDDEEENVFFTDMHARTYFQRYISLFKNVEIVIFFLSQFLFFFGFYLPFIYIPDKAKHKGDYTVCFVFSNVVHVLHL